MRSLRPALTLALVLLSGCSERTMPPPPLPSDLAERLADVAGTARLLDSALGPDSSRAYALVEIDTPDAGRFWLQWISLRHVEPVQIVGAVDTSRVPGPGLYSPGTPSPFLATLSHGEAVGRLRRDVGALAVVNGAFLETPAAPPTEIAFPIKTGGRVVTGGASPYGPGRPGADGRRWGGPLQALVLRDTAVAVVPYDHTTGAPLDGPDVREAVVSYAPAGHPTGVAARFHALGPLDPGPDGASEVLLVLTSSGETTIAEVSRLLALIGVPEPRQIAFDGGASTFVWNRTAGDVTLPARVPARLGPAPPGDGRYTLAHYVGFRLRGPREATAGPARGKR